MPTATLGGSVVTRSASWIALWHVARMTLDAAGHPQTVEPDRRSPVEVDATSASFRARIDAAPIG